MQLESTGKIFIKDIKHFKKKVLLILSNGEEMEITEDIVMDYYLFPNKELNKEDLNNISKSGNMTKALNKAYIDLVNKRNEFQWKLAHQLCRENKLL